MGAWGTGNFENDDAGDWVYELEKSKDKSILHGAFATISGAEYRESPACAEALAAAEVVLAGLSGDAERLPDEAARWLQKKSGLLFRKKREFDASDAALAIEAVRLIVTESELAELWEDSEEHDAWQAVQASLVEKLQQHV